MSTIDPNQILLVIGNEEIANYLMEQLIIGGGYSVTIESNISSALEIARQGNFSMVITQIDTGDRDAERLIKGLHEIDPDILVVGFSEKLTPELLQEAAKLSVSDIITKPINLDRLFFCIKKGIDVHSMLSAGRRHNSILKEQNASLQKQNILLAKRIEESTKNLARLYEDLRSTYMRTIRALAQAIDARDHYTHSHSLNVSVCAVRVAQEMRLSVKEVESIREAAELHDIGKIGIPDFILTKPASLSPEEWIEIKKHPSTGAQILEPLTFLNDVIELVKQHHERYDGRGYPSGLRGEAILLGARVIHLADAYDSMVTARSYRLVPFSKEGAVEEIKKNTGTQFDPSVVDAFLKVVDEL
ncbi:MAG: HD domain-containing protein [Candidatus Omnitrophica bacterium]|nr:HD domain-containing protein [Candidatus Omnitrophota bacterium]